MRRWPILLCCAIVTAAHADGTRVTIMYSPSLDAACSTSRSAGIEQAWVSELLDRQGEFQQLWEEEWPKLRRAAEAITGKAFPAGDFTARLTLCDIPSESLPGADAVLVNMRYALASFTPTPVSLRYKVQTLFHEMLHKYLAQYPMGTSPLLEAHASELPRIRNHLHLFALEKAVLIQVNEVDVLAETIAIDGQLPGPYKRAWAIVNATDAEYGRYVSEIAK